MITLRGARAAPAARGSVRRVRYAVDISTLKSKLLGLLWFWREEQNSEFPKTFCRGDIFLYLLNIFNCNRSPKIKTKNIKNYSSILAIVNHRNWQDESPPLTAVTRSIASVTLIAGLLYWINLSRGQEKGRSSKTIYFFNSLRAIWPKGYWRGT